ncbi:Demethylrebeccamycin-D-glucose O-methyltransferase [Poriferisphaera corsica]|uniref:Arsenite methyltransferase n=1 Tax=Poriferisphaera corsica TaxID=2528020 RepID=A0A517YT47_9BACT|nr:arsenite methyltransferase [Poriferisphaera corsica]QDU33384.1 Demethylrebeccamycin-D-glucose O-methyltransferase [Poriferisphaera corsica]
MTDKQKQEEIRNVVRDGYKKVAETGSLDSISIPTGESDTSLPVSSSCCSPSDDPGFNGCCGSTNTKSADQLAEEIGYSSEQLKALPEGANMGLSCGNPTAIANLKPGQVVLDLGSGGGFDCFLAGPKVGATGRVIGVDMTPEMLTKARKNIASYTKSTGLDNVEFRLGEIENLPVADASVDVVISNCVINLSPDKNRVWQEISRVLKPGGIVAASDIVLYKPIPQQIRDLAEAMVGCVAGAVLLDEYRNMMQQACLTDIHLKPKPEYIDTMARLKAPIYDKVADALPEGETVADYITSADIIATKAKSCCC